MTPITHPRLTDAIGSFNGATSTLRICIVTPDLLGPVRNGGIGTANTFLANELAASGHKVSILFSQCGTTATGSGPWSASYRQRGIEVVVAAEWANQRGHINVQPAHAPLAMAHAVHEWLAEQDFDAVILTEWQGHGFYALQAKRCGLRFAHTAFITQIHSPSLWHATNNADLPTDPMQSLTYFMERKSVELADAVISPSVYMLDWVSRHGFNRPASSFVQPNLLEVDAPVANRARRVLAVNELVFFGRLEYRKGLVQFCDALDRLANLGVAPNSVTFLGKFARVGQEHSGLYIARRAKKWDFPVSVVARLGQAEALNYLSAPGRIAVMPSVADNSPYTVYECLAAGIPFLARDVGGVAELIAAKDRTACLFNDNPNHLAQLFAEVLTRGARRPRLAFDLETNRQAWLEGLPALVRQINQAGSLKKRGKRSATPWVSVCLTHYNRPRLLRQAVASLMEQDYPNLEVILVDDGSPGKEAARVLLSLEADFSRRHWKILRLENGYLGKARNQAVREARGEYLLFMDDDNVARPNMVSRFVQAAVSSGADLVTAVFDVFSGDKAPHGKTPVAERFLPVGDIVSFSVVTNGVGDANSLIRRSLFERLGGFSEDYGLGHEDFELYLRAVLNEAKVSVIPDSLFWYRRNGDSMLSATHAAANRMRSFRPFMDFLPAPMAELAVLAHGLAVERMPRTDRDFVAVNGLLATDQQRLSVGDPDAPETVTALANALMLTGSESMAEAILAELARPPSSGQAECPTAGTVPAIVLAARQGDVKQLQQLIVRLGKSASAKSAIASACFAALAAIERTTPNAEVAKLLSLRLLRAASDSLEANLTAAKHLLAIGNSQVAVNCVCTALALADAAYLRSRPDVAAAVESQHLSCGLEHYYRHGRSEGMQWPESRNFVSVWPQLSMVIKTGVVPHDLTKKSRSLISLALRTFQPLC